MEQKAEDYFERSRLKTNMGTTPPLNTEETRPGWGGTAASSTPILEFSSQWKTVQSGSTREHHGTSSAGEWMTWASRENSSKPDVLFVPAEVLLGQREAEGKTTSISQGPCVWQTGVANPILPLKKLQSLFQGHRFNSLKWWRTRSFLSRSELQCLKQRKWEGLRCGQLSNEADHTALG
jgi:hypothetical protein